MSQWDGVFTLNDWQGEPHEYVCTMFGFMESGPLTGRAGALIGPALFGYSGDDGALRMMLDALKQGDHMQLVADLLRLTTRDGKPLAQEGQLEGAFRGNHLEAYLAAVEVCRVNRFFPVPDGLQRTLSGLLQGMVASLTQAAAATELQPSNGLTDSSPSSGSDS